MGGVFILFMVVSVGSFNSSTQHPVASQATEFASKPACEAAKKSIQEKLSSRANVILLTCESKS